jgi:hypothetical protein
VDVERIFMDKTIIKLLKYHISEGNYEKVESYALIAYKNPHKTRYYKDFIRNAFLQLANYYHKKYEYFKELTYLEYARKISPNNTKILRKLFELWGDFVQKEKFAFSESENYLVLAITKTYIHFYKKKYPGIIKILIDLDVDNIKPSDISKAYHTSNLVNFGLCLYDELTNEQQEELFAEIVAPVIIEQLNKLLNEEKVEKIEDIQDAEVKNE